MLDWNFCRTDTHTHTHSVNNETLQGGYSGSLTRPTRLKNVPVLSYIRYMRVSGFVLRIGAGLIRLFYRSYV